MKHKLIKLPLLVLAMYVLSSSKESISIKNGGDPLPSRDTCVQVKKTAPSAAAQKQAAVVAKEKSDVSDNAKEPLADYKLPLVPFSRFIL